MTVVKEEQEGRKDVKGGQPGYLLQSSLLLTAAQPHDDVSDSKTVEALLVFSGEVLGAACGAVFGGVSGALGGFCAALNGGVGVSFFGFFGSSFGGTVSGLLGGTVWSAPQLKSKAVQSVASPAMWCGSPSALQQAVQSVAFLEGLLVQQAAAWAVLWGRFCATKCVVTSVGTIARCYRETK